MGAEESSNFNNIPKSLVIPPNKYKYLSKFLFEFLYVIGKGGFGKVWKIRYKKTNQTYALKEMSKVKIIDRKSVKNIKTEREFLSILHNPFIINMICSFQDYENLYLVMDLYTGGDLRYHLCREKKFTENQTKFFTACTILGLEYIHNNKIIHRDIKPENLLLNENGYLAITDFGVAKTNIGDNSNETSGTPGYMAPEVLCAQNHSFAVDFYAVGVICFEFMKGERPYKGKSRKEIKEKVLAKQERIHRKDLNEYGWSRESGEFINKMICRKVSKRLGYNGIEEIKQHEWFKDFKWRDLMGKKIKSPFLPKIGDNFDKKYCERVDNIDTQTKDRYYKYMNSDKFENLFLGYTCINFLNDDNNNNENDGDNKNSEKNDDIKQNDIKENSKINNNNDDVNNQKDKILKYITKYFESPIKKNNNNNLNIQKDEIDYLKRSVNNFDSNAFKKLNNNYVTPYNSNLYRSSNPIFLNNLNNNQKKQNENNIIVIVNNPSINIIKNGEYQQNYNQSYLKKGSDNYKSFSNINNNSNSVINNQILPKENINKMKNITSYQLKKSIDYNKTSRYNNFSLIPNNKNNNMRYFLRSSSSKNFSNYDNMRNENNNRNFKIINDYGNYSSKNENAIKELNKNSSMKYLNYRTPSYLDKIENKNKGFKIAKDSVKINLAKNMAQNKRFLQRSSSVRMYDFHSASKNGNPYENLLKIKNSKNIFQKYNN